MKQLVFQVYRLVFCLSLNILDGKAKNMLSHSHLVELAFFLSLIRVDL